MRRSSTITSGPLLLVELDGLLAIARLGDHFHVGLLVDHRGQAVAHHRVIIGEHDADAGLQHGNHSGGPFQQAHADARAVAGLAVDLPFTADGAGTLTHADQTEPLTRRKLRALLHADPVVGDRQNPVRASPRSW